LATKEKSEVEIEEKIGEMDAKDKWSNIASDEHVACSGVMKGARSC
jgi:hypothetical protein